MYEPAHFRAANLPFLWPAIMAASASDMAAHVARQFANLAVGPEGLPAPEPAWATPHKIALELKTARLRDFSRTTEGPATVLCAPFALHGAAIADFAPGYSLVEALCRAGLGRLFVVDWRSASPDMRFRGIDDYLADLNVLVDQIGAPVDLIGLCQGGWIALIYAARFPAKVHKLVLAGAPVDIAAGSSALSALADGSPFPVFQELVRLGDGLVPGRKVLKFWGPETVSTDDIRQLLQTEETTSSPAFARLEGLFRDWYSWTVDLPGSFFLESVEKLYKQNALAAGSFAALGQRIDLATIKMPVFLLAARDDELVAPPQLLAAEHLIGTPAQEVKTAVVAGRHVSLFMGKQILENTWPAIARWIATPSAAMSEQQSRPAA
jgi:poly(3-hydroxyalkanoate) synthetase